MNKKNLYKQALKHPISIFFISIILFSILVFGLTKFMVFFLLIELVFVWNLAQSKYFRMFLEYKEEKNGEEILLSLNLPNEIRDKVSNMMKSSQYIFIYLTKTKLDPLFIDIQRKNMNKIIGKYIFLQETARDYKKYFETKKQSLDEINFEIYYQEKKLKEGNLPKEQEDIIYKNLQILVQRRELISSMQENLKNIELCSDTIENMFYLMEEKLINEIQADKIPKNINEMIIQIDKVEDIISKTKKEMSEIIMDTNL